jgi:glycerol kinase
MQFQSDILGVPVEVPAVIETTALGAAYLAGLAVGFWGGMDELGKKWSVARRYDPRMPLNDRERLYDGWKRAVARAREWVV